MTSVDLQVSSLDMEASSFVIFWFAFFLVKDNRRKFFCYF